MENLQGVEKEMKKKFRDFESAREFARSLHLKSQTEWRKYRISKQMPGDIPSNPNSTYKNVGWKGYGDFLGNGNIAPKDKTYRSFSDTKQFIQKLKLNSRREWNEYCASGNKPDDIPYKVDRTYKKEWTSWGDFLGTGIIATYNIQYRPFKEAREFVRALKITGQRQWQEEYVKSGNKPDDIPSNPQRVYKKEWKGWGDWTGSGNIAPSNLQYRPFVKAREFVRNLGIKNRDEWNEYCKSGKKPDDIPATPWNTYKEWK
jgi:hypothetical protein